MRSVLAFLLMATPALAWKAEVIGQVCVLSHQTDAADVAVRYDPAEQQPYSIAVTRKTTPWGDAPSFAILFEGATPMTIVTDRQILTDDRATLTVSDRGFGNVLNGLAGNETATALLGEDAVSVSLEGAAPEVDRFRDCIVTPIA